MDVRDLPIYFNFPPDIRLPAWMNPRRGIIDGQEFVVFISGYKLQTFHVDILAEDFDDKPAVSTEVACNNLGSMIFQAECGPDFSIGQLFRDEAKCLATGKSIPKRTKQLLTRMRELSYKKAA